MSNSLWPQGLWPARLLCPWDSPGKNTGVGLPFPSPVIKYEVSEVKLLSCVWLFVTPWTVAYQTPPSMGFSRQEYWSGLPFPSQYIIVTSANPKLPIHSSSTSPPPWQSQICSLCRRVCCCFIDNFICAILLNPHMGDIMWYLSFSFWLPSFSIISSRSIHVAADNFISFFFMAE